MNSIQTARLSKDEYFLEMLKLVAARSTCIRRTVGAIIVSKDGHVLSTGYNGVVRGFTHCTDTPCSGANDISGNTSNCQAVHAEQNALLQCLDLNSAHILYCSCVPCFSCAKMICNTNINRVVVLQDYADTRGRDLFLQLGIELEIHG
jgi:dCMP deaminase